MQEQMWQLDQWIQRELEVSAANKRMKMSQDEIPNTIVSTSSDEDDTTAPTPCDQVMAGHKVELHNQMVVAGTGGNQYQIVPIVPSQCEVCGADCDEREITYAP